MSNVITTETLVNGLLTDFRDTYLFQSREMDRRLSRVMDMSINATNRQHEFAYHTAAPHMTYWRRGESIPTDAFESVGFDAQVYTWGRRIPWHKEDRKDDQLQALPEIAANTGRSAALLPERFFFDLITNTTNTLPVVPNASDGAAMYATTAQGANRFGVSGGNLLTGTGLATTSAIRSDYYNVIEQWKQMQDGKGQPLFTDDMVDQGVLIIHAASNTEAFEEAFMQRRQGVVMGTDAGTTPTNLIQDASRDVTLWGTQRLTGNDWYVFMNGAPKPPTFLLEREGLQEFTSLEGDNNGDRVRDTGEEYVQWERRAGAFIGLPFGTIKVNN